MDISLIRPGMLVDGRRVLQVIDTHETAWVKRNGRQYANGSRPIRLVTLAGERKPRRYSVTKTVDATGYVESLPGGPTKSKLANNATRVRASTGKWRGESGKLGELRTWQTDQLTRMPGWDLGAAWSKR